MPNQEPEIHVIPAEFYGAPPVQSGPALVAPSASSPTAGFRMTGKETKTSGFLKSPKFIIGIGLAVFFLVVGGFAYYYIKQAQTARERLAASLSRSPVVEQAPPVVEQPPAAPIVATTTEAAPTLEATPPTPFSAIFPFKNYTKTLDTDNDGLTDEEEKIYGTDPAKPDTDSDGFTDELEVSNLYNPLGFKPVRLLDSGKVKIYLNPTFNYSIFYPADWVTQALDVNNKDVMFTSVSGEFVEALAEDNPLKLSVENWYLGQSPGVEAGQLEHFQTKSKIDGVKSPDGLTAYLPFEEKIFVINYNIGLKTEVNYLATFNMFLNSFKAPGSLEDITIGSLPAASATSAP